MLFDNKSVAFGRNETFLLRYNWIFKGLSSIKKNSKIFQSPDALNELGVGKNMMHSMRYWLSAYQLVDNQNTQNEKKIQLRLKRLFDILLGSLILLFSLPLIVFFGLLIWINDGGPIFYCQIREGFFGNPIKIIKLRTMKIDAEKNGPQWSTKNDSRITFIGKILRRMRIDELPQIISVIKGEMSLIGPRPERPEFNLKLNKLIPNYHLRYYVKPGLSGWAQVNYPYGASIEDAKNKLSYDLYYILNFSCWIDLLILFKTTRVVFSGIGWNPK